MEDPIVFRYLTTTALCLSIKQRYKKKNRVKINNNNISKYDRKP